MLKTFFRIITKIFYIILRLFRKLLKITTYLIVIFIFLFFLVLLSYKTWIRPYAWNPSGFEKTSPLILAILEKDKEKMKIILEKEDANINYGGKFRDTALVYATMNNDLEAVKLLVEHGWYYSVKYGPGLIMGENAEITQYLIDNGAYIHYKSREYAEFLFYPYTAFTEATLFFDWKTMEILLAHGITIHKHEYKRGPNIEFLPYYFYLYCYMSPLIRAVYEDDIIKVKELLKKNKDVNIHFTSLKITPLMLAAQRGNAEMMQLLIDHKADVNAKSKTGWTPLMFAIMQDTDRDYLKPIQILLENNADVNSQNNSGLTALMLAGKRNESGVKLLLEYNADVNIKDNNGHSTLLYFLKGNGYLEPLRKVIEYGADIHTSDKNGKTFLMTLLERKTRSIADSFVKYSSNEDIDKRDNEKRTALMYAAYTYNIDIVLELLDKNASINIKDNKGITPLMYMALGVAQYFDSHKEITEEEILTPIQILIEHGADIHAKNNKGQNIFSWILAEFPSDGHISHSELTRMLLQFFIDNGVDIHIKDNENKTALHLLFNKYLINSDRIDIISFLLEHRLDINARDKDDKTPLYYAKANVKATKIELDKYSEEDFRHDIFLHHLKEGQEVVNFLIEHGAKE